MLHEKYSYYIKYYKLSKLSQLSISSSDRRLDSSKALSTASSVFSFRRFLAGVLFSNFKKCSLGGVEQSILGGAECCLIFLHVPLGRGVELVEESLVIE